MKALNRWFQRLGAGVADPPVRKAPRFENEREVCRYVEDQLRDGLPQAWTHRKQGAALIWDLKMRERRAGSDGDGYILEVSGDYQYFIVYYGNAPGGIYSFGHSFWTAGVITSERLRQCPLSEVVAHVIKHSQDFRENNWSLT